MTKGPMTNDVRQPINILDELHAILANNGIVSRLPRHNDLVTQLVHWAAQAMDPWRGPTVGVVCKFCLVSYPIGMHAKPHKSDCLWQNAVDAGQPAKDALPPAPPAGGWRPMEIAPRDGTPIVLVGRMRSDPTRVRAVLTRWYDERSDSPAYTTGWCFAAPGITDAFDPIAWMPSPIDVDEFFKPTATLPPAPEGSPAKLTDQQRAYYERHCGDGCRGCPYCLRPSGESEGRAR